MLVTTSGGIYLLVQDHRLRIHGRLFVQIKDEWTKNLIKLVVSWTIFQQNRILWLTNSKQSVIWNRPLVVLGRRTIGKFEFKSVHQYHSHDLDHDPGQTLSGTNMQAYRESLVKKKRIQRSRCVNMYIPAPHPRKSVGLVGYSRAGSNWRALG